MTHWRGRMIIISTLLLLPMTGPAAVAQIYQCGVQHNYFDGKEQNNPIAAAYEGVSAIITTRHGAVCDTVTNPRLNWTNAWSMIANTEVGEPGHIQLGFERGYGTYIYYFSEYYDEEIGPPVTRYGTFPRTVGQKNKFWVAYSSACACEKMMIDATVWAQTSWNPYSWWSSTVPWMAQFYGETLYLESDIAGTAASHTKFETLRGQRRSDSGWETMANVLGSYNDNPARWRVQSQGVTEFNIWTI